jgi:hypothetical protein
MISTKYVAEMGDNCPFFAAWFDIDPCLTSVYSLLLSMTGNVWSLAAFERCLHQFPCNLLYWPKLRDMLLYVSVHL